MSNLAEQIISSAITALTDRNLESSEELRPKLLYNDHTKGKAVLCSLSNKLTKCDRFIFSVAFITMVKSMQLAVQSQSS